MDMSETRSPTRHRIALWMITRLLVTARCLCNELRPDCNPAQLIVMVAPGRLDPTRFLHNRRSVKKYRSCCVKQHVVQRGVLSLLLFDRRDPDRWGAQGFNVLLPFHLRGGLKLKR